MSLPTDAHKDLFISYSRVDVAYARDLAATLTDLGFTLWRDRSDLEGGENWWQQIEAAIRNVDSMILLLSEASLNSKIVSKEWRYARQLGTRVIPVIADGFAPERAPRWMSKRDWYDFRRRDHDPDQQVLWEKLLVQLRAPYQRKRVPFMVEDLPIDYIPRTATLSHVIGQLIDDTREEPRAVTVALRGAGGYGKTTMARAVCADERIQAAFDDGILWVTFGEKVENLTAKVDDLVYTLTGRHSNANSLETATSELIDALADRDLLLVLDDLWNMADLKPFLQGGSRCARLITTRDAGTLPINTVKIAVDHMAKPEAVALLTHGLPIGEGNGFKVAFERLAERLGNWPLLIKLVNGQLRDAVLDFHQPLGLALADINQGLDEGGLTVFDLDNTTDRHKAVSMTIELSLGKLSAEEKARFNQLLIFPEDVTIPLDIVGRLWELSAIFTKKLCGRLFNMSLLLEYSLETSTLRLHDMVRDYLMGTNPDGETGKVAAHQKLLDSYKLERWSDLPESERYLWEYLAWHLLGAGQEATMIDTVSDIHYLAKKSMYLSPLKIETDLTLLIEKFFVNVMDYNFNLVSSFYSNFTQITHILERCETLSDSIAVIWNRNVLGQYSKIREKWQQNLQYPALLTTFPLPDLPPNSLIRTLVGHRDSIKGISFSPFQQRQLVSIGDDYTLRRWNWDNGEQNAEPIQVSSEGRGVAWSADGTFIVAAFRNGEIGLYDPILWTEYKRWNAHDDQVRGIAIRKDSEQIASVSRDQSVKLWNRKGTLIHTLLGHMASVEAVAYSSDLALIATCDYNGLILVWNTETGIEYFRLLLTKERCFSISFSRDNDQLAIGCKAGRVMIWTFSTGEAFTLHAQDGDVRAVAFSPQEELMLSGSSDRSVVLWNSYNWKPEAVWQDHLGIIRTATWEDGGGIMATAASDRLIKIWNRYPTEVDSGDPSETLQPRRGTYFSIAYTQDGRLIALEKSGRVVILDPDSNKPPQALPGFRNDTKSIAHRPGGNWILGVNGTESVKRWDAGTGKRSGFLVAETGARIATANYAPDDETLVTIMGDDRLQIRSAHDLSLIREWFAPDHRTIQHASYSPDGQTVVASADDGSLYLWTPATDALRILTGHKGTVNSAQFSPDGLYIASASSDRSVKMWDAATGRCLHTFHSSDGGLYSVAWHPDSARIVVGGARGLYWLVWER